MQTVLPGVLRPQIKHGSDAIDDGAESSDGVNRVGATAGVMSGSASGCTDEGPAALTCAIALSAEATCASRPDGDASSARSSGTAISSNMPATRVAVAGEPENDAAFEMRGER